MSEKFRSGNLGSSVLPDKPKNPVRSAFVSLPPGSNRQSSRDSTPCSHLSQSQPAVPPPFNPMMSPYAMNPMGTPGMLHPQQYAYYQPQPPIQMSPYWNFSATHYPPMQPNFYPQPAVSGYAMSMHPNLSGHQENSKVSLERPPSRQKENEPRSADTINYHANLNSARSRNATEDSSSGGSRGQTPQGPQVIPPTFSTPYGPYPNKPEPPQMMQYPPNAYMSPQSFYPTGQGYDAAAWQMYQQWYKMYSRAMREMYYPYLKKSERRSDREEVSMTQDSVYSPTPSSVINQDIPSPEAEKSPKQRGSMSVVKSGRKTPERFYAFHSVAKFSPNGSFLFTDASNAGSGPGPLYIQSGSFDSRDSIPDLLESFPGPLFGFGSMWKVSKTDVRQYLNKRLKDFRHKKRSNFIGEDQLFHCVGDLDDFIAVLKLLLLLNDNDGIVDDLSICELLAEDLSDSEDDMRTPTSLSLSDLNETILTSPTDDSKPAVMAKLTKMLLRGETKKFVDLAIKEEMWGIALRFSQMMCSSLFNKVCQQFDQSNVKSGDPLKTYINIKSSKSLKFVESEALICSWKEHLAVILANCEESAKLIEYCVSLGDVMQLCGRSFASQFCYLSAKCNFGWPRQVSKHKLVLVGLVEKFEEALKLSSTGLLPVILSMVYENCLRSSDATFFIPFLQHCKFAVAQKCFECGMFPLAFKYCENIAECVHGRPQEFNWAFVSLLNDMITVLALRLNKRNESWVRLFLNDSGIEESMLQSDHVQEKSQKIEPASNSIPNARYSTIDQEPVDSMKYVPGALNLNQAAQKLSTVIYSPGPIKSNEGKQTSFNESNRFDISVSRFPGPAVPEDDESATTPLAVSYSNGLLAGCPTEVRNQPRASFSESFPHSSRAPETHHIFSTNVESNERTKNHRFQSSFPETEKDRAGSFSQSWSSVPRPPSELPFNDSAVLSRNGSEQQLPYQTVCGENAQYITYASAEYSSRNANLYNPESIMTFESTGVGYDGQYESNEDGSGAYMRGANPEEGELTQSQLSRDQSQSEDSEENSSSADDDDDDDEEEEEATTTETSSPQSSGQKSYKSGGYNFEFSVVNKTALAMGTASMSDIPNPPTAEPEVPPPFSMSYTQNAMPSAAPNPFSRSSAPGNRMNQYQQYPNAFKVSQVSNFVPPPAMPTPQHMYEPSMVNNEAPPLVSNQSAPLQGGPAVPASILQPSEMFTSSNSTAVTYASKFANSPAAAPVSSATADEYTPVIPTFFNPAKFKNPAPMGPPMFPPSGKKS